jgi:glycosyltransferase involved in cell wall biosynthesis
MEAVVIKSNAIDRAPRFNRRLGIITHVPHWRGKDGVLWAYEPYVRELRLWADLFAAVEVLAPAAEGPMQGNQAAYERTNIGWRSVSYSLSYEKWAPLQRLAQMPALALGIQRLIRDCDLIHLRGPGHPALLGNLLVRLCRQPSITKWAGLFASFEGERWPSRVERRLVGFGSAGHPVLIYGPSNHQHIISFSPALMSEAELSMARALSARKHSGRPWQLLSVGRLLAVKNFDLAIRGLGELYHRRPDLEWEYTLIGDGPEAIALHELARRCEIAERVRFAGALPFTEVQKYYAAAQLVIMPGVKEGWPKIIAEAWAHAAVPLAAAAGIVPWILEGDKYGISFKPSASGLADALSALLYDNVKLLTLVNRIAHRADELSLERFKKLLEKVLVEHCGLN